MDKESFRTQAEEMRALLTELRHLVTELKESPKPASPAPVAGPRPKDPAMECTDSTVHWIPSEEGPKIYRGDDLILVESASLFMWFLDRKPLTLKQKNCAPYYHLIRHGVEFREIQL